MKGYMKVKTARKKVLEITVVCLIFLILALIDTYPLINYIDKGMPYASYPAEGHEITYTAHGDYLQLYYHLWLFKDALFGDTPFFRNPYEFSAGENIWPTFTTQALPLSFFYAILSPFGEVTAYSLLVIASYILAGLSGYLLVKLFTGSSIAGILGGVIFSLFPYRTGVLLGGHSAGFVFFLLPLTLYFLESSFRKKSWIYSIGAGLTIASMSFLEYHLFYYTLLFLAFFLPWRLLSPFHGKNPPLIKNSPSPPFIKGGKEGFEPSLHLKDALIVFLSGTAVGLSLILVRTTPPIFSNPLFYTSIIFPFSLFLCWILYSRAFSLVTGIPLRQSLKEDASSYLPLLSFLLYFTRFVYPIEHLGKVIAVISLVGIISIKMYILFRYRNLLYERLKMAIPELKTLFIKTILPLSLIILLTIGWSFYLRSFFQESIAGEGRPLHQVMRYSPQVNDFFDRHNRDVAKNIYLGVVPLLLTGVGLFFGKKEWRRERVFFGGVFFVSLILSFGPNLEPYIPFYTILYNHLPFFNYPRVAGRIITITVVSMAILAGYGVKGLIERGQDARYKRHDARPAIPISGIRNPASWIILIFIGILLDFIPFSSRGISIVARENPIYEEVKKGLGDKKVLEIPIWPGDSAWSSVYQYYVTLYRYQMINGYSPAVTKKYVDQIFKPLSLLNFGELREKEYKLLRELEVKYIVMHEEEFPRKVSPFPFSVSLENMKKSPFVKFIKEERPLYLFELKGEEEIDYSKTPSFIPNTPIGGVYEAEVSPRSIGRLVQDIEASRKEAVSARAGEGEGFLVYGPYRIYPSGRYIATFRLKIDNNTATKRVVWSSAPIELAFIEVVAEEGRERLNSRILTTIDFKDIGYQDFILPFELSSPKAVEFRVYYKNMIDLWADYTYILTYGEKDPRRIFKAEELFHLPGRLIKDGMAISGKAVVAFPGKAPKGESLIDGPTRRYPDGEYIATFWLNTLDNKILKDIAVIRILGDGEIITERRLKGRDFPSVEEYFPFPLKFTITKPLFIDFRVIFEDVTTIGMERVEIEGR
jgi:hypothetical protein